MRNTREKTVIEMRVTRCALRATTKAAPGACVTKWRSGAWTDAAEDPGRAGAKEG